jgi:hypothetical protein
MADKCCSLKNNTEETEKKDQVVVPAIKKL